MLRIICVIVLLASSAAAARDFGQWEEQPQNVRGWFQKLMQPDNPYVSCCGEADAYWADSYEVDADRYVAIITDERTGNSVASADEPPGRRGQVNAGLGLTWGGWGLSPV
jgi:hypothetical protein